MDTIAISARMEVTPQRIDDYLAAAQEVMTHTRREPGCRHYAFAQDLLAPNVIWISEEWDSDEALQQHFATPHINTFLKRVADIELLDMDVRKYSISAIDSITPPPIRG